MRFIVFSETHMITLFQLKIAFHQTVEFLPWSMQIYKGDRKNHTILLDDDEIVLDDPVLKGERSSQCFYLDCVMNKLSDSQIDDLATMIAKHEPWLFVEKKKGCC